MNDAEGQCRARLPEPGWGWLGRLQEVIPARVPSGRSPPAPSPGCRPQPSSFLLRPPAQPQGPPGQLEAPSQPHLKQLRSCWAWPPAVSRNNLLGLAPGPPVVMSLATGPPGEVTGFPFLCAAARRGERQRLSRACLHPILLHQPGRDAGSPPSGPGCVAVPDGAFPLLSQLRSSLPTFRLPAGFSPRLDGVSR